MAKREVWPADAFRGTTANGASWKVGASAQKMKAGANAAGLMPTIGMAIKKAYESYFLFLFHSIG